MEDLTWKNWVIGALWAISMALLGAGYVSVDRTITSIHEGQIRAAGVLAEYKLTQEKERATLWRVIDRLCFYQSDRLHKEGKRPEYIFPETK